MAAAASCDLQGAESAEEDSAELEHAAAPSAAASALSAGSRIDREQLVQLFGEVPAAVGESCPTLGLVCAPQAYAATTSCGSFSDTCDMTGTQTGVLVDFICLNSNGSATCTAVAQQTPVTHNCTRQTNGLSCGSAAGCGAAFCLAYSSTCDESTSQVRNCKAAGVCSNGTCNQPVTQEAVGTCQRNTDGKSCAKSCADGDDVATCRSGGCACPRIVCPDVSIAACPRP